jgi:hypothetical protein
MAQHFRRRIAQVGPIRGDGAGKCIDRRNGCDKSHCSRCGRTWYRRSSACEIGRIGSRDADELSMIPQTVPNRPRSAPMVAKIPVPRVIVRAACASMRDSSMDARSLTPSGSRPSGRSASSAAAATNRATGDGICASSASAKLRLVTLARISTPSQAPGLPKFNRFREFDRPGGYGRNDKRHHHNFYGKDGIAKHSPRRKVPRQTACGQTICSRLMFRLPYRRLGRRLGDGIGRAFSG